MRKARQQPLSLGPSGEAPQLGSLPDGSDATLSSGTGKIDPRRSLQVCRTSHHLDGARAATGHRTGVQEEADQSNAVNVNPAISEAEQRHWTSGTQSDPYRV